MTTEEHARSLTVRLPSLRGAVGTLVVAVVIAGGVVGGIRTHDLVSKNHRLEHGLSTYEISALRAARGYAVTFATYKYDDLDASFAATEAHAVDPFLSQYRSTTAQLRESLTKAKASSTAKVISAGLASVSAHGAVVDLFLDQTIENAKGSHRDAQRVEMTLVQRNGKWLISKVVLP